MNGDENAAGEEHLTSWLIACDAALAAGAVPPVASAADTPLELRPRLARGLECLQLLEEVWPRRRGEKREWSTEARPPGPLPADPSTHAPVLSPSHLGRFQIRRELGHGTFGIVYLADDPRLGREVALKIPRADIVADPHLRERFQREARAAAVLDHPNVVPVYDAGEVGSVCFIASAYCPGITLAEWLKQRTELVPVREAAQLVTTLAQAVQHAHDHGVVHRDLKPANILLQEDLTQRRKGAKEEESPSFSFAPLRLCVSFIPKIADFGLAKFLAGEPGAPMLGGQTQTGAIVGTPSYMAPEQAEGKSQQIGPATDLYALGAILYELLTGRPPFQAESTLGLLMLVRTEEPVPPRRLRLGLPRDLETICLRCLHKDPAKRYRSAGALAEDLRRFQAGEPILARPSSPLERGVKWARRRPAYAALLALAAVVTLVGFPGVTWLWQRAETARGAEAQARNDLQFNLYLRNIPLAQVEASVHNWGGVEELLKDCPERLRGWEWDYLKRLPDAPLREATAQVNRGISANLDLAFHTDGRLLAGPGPGNTVTLWDLTTGKERRLAGHTGQVLCVAFSPTDGQLLVSAGRDGTVQFWELRTGEPVRTLLKAHGEKSIDGLTFSPDGRLLATLGADEKARLWEVATGKQLHEFEAVYWAHARQLRRMAFSPDGRLFACGGPGNTVRIWDVATSQPVRTLEGHEDLVFAVAFSPQGDRLASASWDLTARVWEVASGRELFGVRGHSSAAWSVEFSPNGSLLAVAGGTADPAVKLYEARTGQLVHTLEGHASRVGCVAFHPEGRRLASCSIDQTVRIWELDRGREVLTLRGHTDLITRVLFDPKGRWLASASDDGQLRVWDGTPRGVGPGRPGVPLCGHSHTVFGVAFSPDGRQLASASQDGTVRVWDVATAQEVHTLHGHTETVFAVAFGRDGLLVSGSYDGTTKLWDARTGVLVDTREGPEARPRGLALSADGKRVVTGSITPPFQIWLWDVRPHGTGLRLEKRQALLEGHNGPAYGVAFSPDGQSVATAAVDGKVILWDAATGRKQLALERLASRARAWTVAFHPLDGRHLAAGYSAKQLLVWDWKDAEQEPMLLAGHTNDVYSVAYSPDGRWLASASWQEVIVWDVETRARVRTLSGYPGLIWSVAWSPDGEHLAVGSGRKNVGEIELWKTADLIEKTAAAAPGR